jgi:erythromycin esterase-like protein
MRGAVEDVRKVATALDEWAPRYDDLLKQVGNARYVLLGEASHGTHEFYQERARITKRLIAEKGFSAVAVEADWPDAFRVNRYVRGESDDRDAEEALGSFKRFPTWMWRNVDVVDFVGWLRDYNDTLPAADRAGFYGLDLYSLFSSIEAVTRYLDRIDPEAAARARRRYACFDHFEQDSQAYGYAAAAGLVESCEPEVVAQLMELRQAASGHVARDGPTAEDDRFFAEQNARLVKNAEAYYRSMFRGRIASWNLRDQHMVETLDMLVHHLGRRGQPVKTVVWAHNSHLGDARATEMGQHGELNVGQLVREREGVDAALIGFTTHEGTVTAAAEWDGAAQLQRVRPSLPDSVERIFHATRVSRFFLDMRRNRQALAALEEPRLERAIGVIYRPETERSSHYFHVHVVDQFDGVIHIDHTRAVEPLERSAAWRAPEPAETYPSGL